MKRGPVLGLVALVVVVVTILIWAKPWDSWLKKPQSSGTQTESNTSTPAANASTQLRKTIRIGTTISETGKLARVASLHSEGRRLAIDLINALSFSMRSRWCVLICRTRSLLFL
ncbi:hypothetical protein HY229_01760 [Candidatus Acetothermia bacterium]|nr:hypothetical protein [Candidatus Acetothermia bacterium]MBI3642816.1 hypothetical protein [Candidatus Acetothermia bacterium]